METHMIGAVSIIEHHVASALNGARLIGLIFERREVERKGYWEDRYTVAWENDYEAGTHNANVNSDEEVMLTSGHYVGRLRPDFSEYDRSVLRQQAIEDMLSRTYRVTQ